MDGHRVVIIGAGFAGLGAAVTLLKHGVTNLVILEALDRAGGRVWTHKPVGAPILELGATWIHGQMGNPLYQMATEKGLLAKPASDTSEEYFFDEQGKHLPPSQVEEVSSFFKRLMSQINEKGYKPEFESWSVGKYLDSEFALSNLSKVKGNGGIYEWCKRTECVDEAANSMYEFSLNQNSLYTVPEGPFYNSLGSKGYQGVLDVLINQLPSNTLRCRKPVQCIHWEGSSSISEESEHSVNVVCADGEQFPADHVIVTVSLGCLKERVSTLFDPPLPKEKTEAIQRLGFGTVAKIFLEFSEPFWPDDCAGIQLAWEQVPEGPEWFKKIVGFDCVPEHRSTLCGWITGLAAEHMETLPESEVGEACVSLLKKFTGWPVTELRGVLRSRWHSNPFIRGSYTNVPLGVDAVKEQKALAEPLPSTYESGIQEPLQVLFAGEATHPNFYTTTHGAYMSGIREAERLIKLFENTAL